MGSLHHMPPRGHYLANEVGRLAGVSGHEIGQWARYAYIRSSQSPKGVSPRVYSYQDIAEAMVVHHLWDEGVGYRRIKTVLVSLREDGEVGDWPLSSADLATSAPEELGATTTVLVRKGDEHYDVSDRPWHQVMRLGDLRRIAGDLNRGGWAVRELPNLKHIEVNPDRLSGRPVVRGHRMAARSVAELALVEGGDDLLRDEYGINDEEIEDAVRWWEVARRYEAA